MAVKAFISMKNHLKCAPPPPHLKRVSFSQVALAPSAVMAFRDLCIECTDILAPEIELLVEPFFSVYQNPTIKNREKVTDVSNML